MTLADDLAALIAAREAATKGPWAWFHTKHETYLATVDRGRVFVMGFARRGMQSAQPMFQVDHVMRTAEELGESGVRAHPDAAFIALAANVIEAHGAELAALVAENARLVEVADAALDLFSGSGTSWDPAPFTGRDGHYIQMALHDPAGKPIDKWPRFRAAVAALRGPS